MSGWNFDNAVVAVSGAASGIGFALCKRLRAEGATPLMLDRDEGKLRAAAAEIYAGDRNPSRFAYVVDVTDSAAVDRCFEAMEKDHGPITHAVANAAITMVTNILEVADEDWKRILDVNLHGVMYFCRATARSLVKSKRGSIVLLSSIAGMTAKESRIAYSSSKGAIISLTRALPADLGSYGIRVTSVAPGVIDTPQQLINPGTCREAQAKRTMLGRTGPAGRDSPRHHVPAFRPGELRDCNHPGRRWRTDGPACIATHQPRMRRGRIFGKRFANTLPQPTQSSKPGRRRLRT
jgi:NAD(P)-dependent dehydrogenase (short-subunit alcohol dehydrogenase family)